MRDTTIGFIGVGTITAAMVRGMLAAPVAPVHIHLSPRNADTAAKLAAEFAAVSVAPDNQAVIDRSEIIVLAIRPQIAQAVTTALSFRPGQSVISVVAATERQTLQNWIGTEVHLVQAIPLPFVEERLGVTALYPPDPDAKALFDILGTALECVTRHEYNRLAAVSALMSTYFGIMEIATEWLQGQGVERSQGQAYLAPLFHSLASRANTGIVPFAALSREFATPGGLNEQVLTDFGTGGGKAALLTALDNVLARIENTPRDGKA